jgi:hypothetical protein
MAITKEFSPRSKNIDSIIDMMISTQIESGVEPHMREAMYDPVTNERINQFQRERLERKGVDLSNYPNSGCRKNCNKCGEKKPLTNIERGVFVYSENDLIDETDEAYICDFCTKIHYDNKYLPEACDICSDCETCMDYRNGSCDGCAYSHVYNGMSYSAATGEDTTTHMKPEDEAIFSELSEEAPDYDVHYPTGGFTVLFYD